MDPYALKKNSVETNFQKACELFNLFCNSRIYSLNFTLFPDPTYGVPMHELNGGFQHMNGPNPSAPNLVQYGVQPSAPPLPSSSPPPAFQYIPPPPSSQEIQESTSS